MKSITYSLFATVFGSSAFAVDFHPRVLLTAGDKPIKVQDMGYSAPCWADVDGDGKKDLLVGQFSRGRINVFSGAEGINKLGAGTFLKTGTEIATVPGVG